MGRLASVWAIVGVSALFALAVARLGTRGLEGLTGGLTALEWGLLASLVVLFVVGEGWAALQRKWVPRVVSRARALRESDALHHRLLAPLYGMSLIGGKPRTCLRAWAGVAAVVLAVVLVRMLPDPWRAMIDLAVASALSWGLVALLLESRRLAD